MSMTHSEAAAVQDLIRYYQNVSSRHEHEITPERAASAWMKLTEASHDVLGHGWAPKDIYRSWKPFHVRNPLRDYDREDPEQCPACNFVEDTCPYHRGMQDGVSWLTKVVNAIDHDPEHGDGILYAEARRREQDELHQKQRETRVDCTSGYACTAGEHTEGCLSGDSIAGLTPECEWGVSHSSVYTVPIRTRTTADFTQARIPGSVLVVRLEGDTEWLRFADGQPVRVREF